METLRNHELYKKFSKCNFWVQRAHFLEHIVPQENIMVNSKKVEVVIDWDKPKTFTKIYSFLGMAGYYKRFIQDFSRIATSLIRLTQKGV